MSNLIPKHWNIQVDTGEELLFLGKDNIEAMMNSHKWRIKSLQTSIDELYNELKLFSGKSAADIRQLSQEFDSPAVDMGNPYGDKPEPIDAASINRKSGTTNFNICGWCSYSSGVHRFGYTISGNCKFEKYLGIRHEIMTNSGCWLRNTGSKDMQTIAEGIREKISEYENDEIEAKVIVAQLTAFARKAVTKPVLPDHRPQDWANVESEVVCYLGGWGTLVIDEVFAAGYTIPGYRTGDGCVSVCFDKKVHSGENLDGHGGGYGCSRPEIMEKWEYEYLKNNLDYCRVWASESTCKDFDKDRFVDDMEQRSI